MLKKISFTSDVIVSFEDEVDNRFVLLVKRKSNPFKGMWAIPGGHLDVEETSLEAAQRELGEETSVWLPQNQFHFLNIYDDPGRDPRTRTVTAVYFCFLDKIEIIKKLSAGDDADEVKWFRVDKLPELAFDHEKIIKDFLEQQYPVEYQFNEVSA